MTTAAQLIEATLGHLFTGQAEQQNQLDGAVNDSATTLTFAWPLGHIVAGVYLSVGLEDVYVWETPSATTATVSRGQRGTTAASHGDGDIVKVAPRFPPARVLGALNADLADLSSPVNGLFRMLAVDVTYTAGVAGYDLAGITADWFDIYELRYKLTGAAHDWPVIPSALWSMSSVMAASEFGSGNALFVTDSAQSGQPIRVRYKAPFGTLAALTDEVETAAGLPASAVDLPPLGAAVALAAGREVRRNFDESEGNSRRAEEVPAGANLNAAAGLRAQRAARIRAEATRLGVRYPAVRA